MKHKYLIVFLLAALASSIPQTSSAAQESPIHLYEVIPPEGFPGEHLGLSLLGDGFLKAEVVGVEIEGIEVREFWINSNNELGADVYIPESAPPGPRTVIVHGSLGQNEPVEAVLEAGFFVLEREEVPPAEPPPGEPPPEEPPYEPPYEPTPEGDGFPWWILILVLGGLGVAGVAVVTLAAVLYRANLKQTWQQQASSQELPKNCHPSSHINRREKIELKPGRWKVTGVKITLYDAIKNERGKTYTAPGDLVSKIDKAARRRLLRGEDDQLRGEIAEMGKELSALVMAWQIISERGKDAYLETHMEGGSAEAKFARYRCVGQPGQWKKVLEWTAKLKAVDNLPASFRAPLASESQQAYRVFLEQQLDGYLTGVVKEAARLL